MKVTCNRLGDFCSGGDETLITYSWKDDVGDYHVFYEWSKDAPKEYAELVCYIKDVWHIDRDAVGSYYINNLPVRKTIFFKGMIDANNTTTKR